MEIPCREVYMRKQRLLRNIKERLVEGYKLQMGVLIAMFVFVILLAGLGYYWWSVERNRKLQSEEAGAWYTQTDTICHAGGMTEQGDIQTNSLEALTYNYEQGHRVFEVDMQMTSDGVMVLRHDWSSDLGQADDFGWTEEKKTVPTAEQFLNAPIYDKYTPLTLQEFYSFMQKRGDMYVVIDPKYMEDIESQFTLIVDTAVDNGYGSVLDRVIVQLYYEHMYERVKSIYPFKSYLYTLYYNGYSGTGEEERFCVENGIPVLVMPSGWANEAVCKRVKKSKLKLFVHPVNDVEVAERLLDMGVYGIYSDVFLPGQFQSMTSE